MVQPGREDVQAPQVAPVLVRHDVVGVVAPRAEEPIRADQRFTFRRDPERDRTVLPVAAPCDGYQQPIDVLGEQRAQLADRGQLGGVVLDDQPFAIEDDQVGFRDVVAERVEDARRNHLGAGRQFRGLGRIETQQEQVFAGIPEEDCRTRDPVADQHDPPRPCHRRRIGIAASAAQFVEAQLHAAVPVDEPGTVEHLTQRIDALGRNDAAGRLPLAWMTERRRRGFEQEAEVASAGIDRRTRRRLAVQRVVGKELLRRSLRSASRATTRTRSPSAHRIVLARIRTSSARYHSCSRST